MSLWTDIEKVLLRVEKPARYVGAEMGGVAASRDSEVEAFIVLAFPDLYEIGASYHGYRILYERVNSTGRYRAERAFAPWQDFEREMRRVGIPLFTVETFRPVREADVIGFTLQHELNYTTVLNMLDLAGLAVRASQRRLPWPLVIAGGEGALAPEVLSPFIDAFVLGDGEEVLLEILECVAGLKRQPLLSKDDALAALACIEGVYVPSLVEFGHAPDGTIACWRRIQSDRSEQSDRSDGSDKSDRSDVGADFSGDERFHRRVFDLAGDDGPTGPVVPLSRIVHDRLVIEIRRGCTRGCRFCSSGMISRPVRERPPEQILRIAEQGLAATGYRDVSLLSLSSGDYSEIVRLVGMLTDRFRNRLVAVSLPSLRISTFDVTLAEQIGEVRKTGFTFAPEAGTERLRAVINKPLTDQQFAEVVDAVCRAGWQTLKFYFMIGLPTETDDDLQGIARMVRRAEQIGRGYWKGRLAINVTLAPFVPKPHTPFQWEAQVGREEMERRCRLVADGLHGSRSVHIKRHSVESSFIEAVLARGDRRVADALERAWQLGCNLDAWSDRFNLGLWLRAFEETGLDPSWYANRARSDDEVFPWDHIDAGPGKSFLLEQRRAAMRGEILDDCALEGCAGCQACSDGLGHKLVGAAAAQRPATDAVVPPSSASQQTSQPPESRVRARGRHRSMLRQQPSRAASEQPLPIQRIRLSYSKEGRLRFLSHLDMVKTWQLLVERAGLPIAYSRGFHPVALLQYSPPLAVGYGARGEWVDIFLRERMGPEQVVRRLAEIAPDGMRIFAPLEIALSAKALDRSIVAADFEIQLSPRLLESAALSVERIRQIWQESKDQAAGPAPQAQPQQEGCRSAALMEALEVISTSPAVLHMRIRQSGGNLPDPLRLLRALLGVELRLGDEAEVTRLGLISEPLSIRVPAR